MPVAAARRALSASATPLDPGDVGRVLDHLYGAVRARGINMGWINDFVAGVAPLEAHPTGGGARFARAMHGFTRSRLGALTTRGLARFRRRLRVKSSGDSAESSHL